MKDAYNFYDNKFWSSSVQKPIYAPIDDNLIGHTHYFDVAMLDELVLKMKVAQQKWASLTLKKRTQVLYNYRHLLIKHKEHLAKLISLENGKTNSEATAEVLKAIEQVELACSMPQFINNEIQEVSNGVYCALFKKPVGIIASITPFNFPMMVPHWSIPNALVLGNAIILKPSFQTPLTPNYYAHLLKDAGLDPNLFVVLNGEIALTDAILKHPNIPAITFVGSTNVAKSIYHKASSFNKRVLALGGAKNHILVLPDYDSKTAVNEIINSAIGMSGQRCMAASVIVTVGKNNHFKEEFISELAKKVPGKDLPPLISKDAINKLKEYANKAKEIGAQVILDGSVNSETLPNQFGYFLGPILIDWSEHKDQFFNEEAFGPLIDLIHFDTLSEAIQFQNSSIYGNGASVFTKSGRFGFEVAHQLSAGMIGINIGVPIPREPFSFGGIKYSKFGHGDITGKSSIEFYTYLVKLTFKFNPLSEEEWMH